jgi:hypothetical protein
MVVSSCLNDAMISLTVPGLLCDRQRPGFLTREPYYKLPNSASRVFPQIFHEQAEEKTAIHRLRSPGENPINH